MKTLKTLTGQFGPFKTIVETDTTWECDVTTPGTGVVYPKGVIGEATIGEYVPPVVVPVKVVPVKVSMRQARLALFKAGLLDDIEAIINVVGPAAKIEWDYSTEVQRTHQLIAIVQAQNQMTKDQIDDLFIEASKL